MYTSGDPFTTIGALIIFIIVIATCCFSDNNSSTKNTAKKTVKRQKSNNTTYTRSSYDFCPSCGAPYYDGYCDECGYPDINQGWLGENF